MRLLLDQGIPRTAAVVLRDMGHDAVHVSDIGMSRAADAEILELAAGERRCVVTLDTDFHAWLAVLGAHEPSVVRIRAEGLDGTAMAHVILRILLLCQEQLEEGAVATFKDDRVRIRRLPVR